MSEDPTGSDQTPTDAARRKGTDRRTAQQPFDGADRRTGDRRSGTDRRGTPRAPTGD